MGITVEEMNSLPFDEYKVIDMRSESERSYGLMPNSIWITEDELDNNLPENKDIKYILVCRRGLTSQDTSERMCEAGYDAVSLDGGYNAWILSRIGNIADDENIAQKVEHSIHKKFRDDIMSKFTKALKIYKLVNEGDKIAVCISGGKDSMLMAKLFQELKKYSHVNFDVEYIVMDPGYNETNRKVIENNAKNLNIPIKIFETDIFSSVYNVEKSPCYLCARMRRGHLYNFAKSLGCNKIALGHHYDDVIETILMGMLYGAQVQTMMPKLHSTNFEGMELIRPMYLIREADIIKWRDYNNLSFIQCACKFTENCATCTNEETKSKRLETKNLIKQLKKTNPDVESRIFRSVENVNIDTVIAYKTKGKTYNFLDDYDSVD